MDGGKEVGINHYVTMEQNYVIGTDSSCDLPAELAQELELAVLPLTLTLRGKEYANYLRYIRSSTVNQWQRWYFSFSTQSRTSWRLLPSPRCRAAR